MTTTITSVPALASPTPVVPITVSIFSHVERLGPIYDTGWVHFSVNLSAALVDGTDQITPEDVAKFLKLWAWDWSSLAILGIDDKDKTVIFDPDSITLLLDQAPAPIDALKDALTLEIGRTIAIDPTLRAFRTHAPLEEKTIDEKTRNWKSFLAHVSTFPAPLPQSLKLCAFFRVKA